MDLYDPDEIINIVDKRQELLNRTLQGGIHG